MVCSCNKVDHLRAGLDKGYASAALIGLHPYEVTVVTVTRSGVDKFGEGGTVTSTENRLLLGDGYVLGGGTDGYLNPKVEQVASRDVFLSGGVLADTDYKIGPLVFPYETCDGYQRGSDFSRTNASNSPGVHVELYFWVQGPEFPDGVYFKRLSSRADSSLAYYLFIRNTGLTSVPNT